MLSSAAEVIGGYSLGGGGGSFSSTPSPRGASVPVPTGVGNSAAAESQASAASQAGSNTATYNGSRPSTGNGGGGETHEGGSGAGTGRSQTHHETVTGSSKGKENGAAAHGKEGGTPTPTGTHAAAAKPDLSKEGAPSAGAMVTTAKSLWTADAGWGWYNKYYFRGIDILKEISPKTNDGGVINTKFTLAYSREKDAFSIGFGYVQALERQIPDGEAKDVTPNNTVRAANGKFVPKKDNEKFSLAPASRYAEYDLYLAYTRELIPGKLQGTLGYNHYQFSDGRFYDKGSGPIYYADETTVRLDYLGLPIVRPSVTWAHDFDGFQGDYLEMRLDAGFDVYKHGNFSVRLEPYVAGSYDFKYNGGDNGWNALEFGVGVPIRLNENLSLTLTGNYTHALDESQGQPRANTGFWGGVVLNAAWGGSSMKQLFSPSHAVQEGKDGDKLITMPVEDKKTEVSLGMGVRGYGYDYNFRHVTPFDPGSLYTPKFRVGDLGLAGPGNTKIYDNGAVFGAPLPVPPTPGVVDPSGGKGFYGVQAFKVNSASQVSGSVANGNDQVRFSTTAYSYGTKLRTYSPATNDEDWSAYPYLNIDHEFLRQGPLTLRAGLRYDFSESDSDSGISLARLDSLFERQSQFGYVYSLDAVSTNVTPGSNFNSLKLANGQFAAVVTNPALYSTAYSGLVAPGPLADSGPRSTFLGTTNEVVRVATFVHSKVSLTSNEIAVPISLRYDLSKRFHAEVSVAPTLTIANADMQTDVYRRALSDGTSVIDQVRTGRAIPGGVQGSSSAAFSQIPQSPFINPAAFGQSAGFTSSVSKPAVPSSTATVASSGGGGGQASFGTGKSGKNPSEPSLPGSDVGHKMYTDNSTKVIFGIDGTLSLTYDLSEDGTFFAEMWGRYHWSDHYAVNNGLGSSGIDLSGFQAGLGLGFRF